MKLNLNTCSFVIFDLDDTLFKEIDFLKSGFTAITKILPIEIRNKTIEDMLKKYKDSSDVFNYLLLNFSEYFHSMEELSNIYRNHSPNIKLSDGVQKLFENLMGNKTKTGLITDGRRITQRNKLESLGISSYFNEIIISEEFGSEKPNMRNFEYFQNKYTDHQFIYIADNPSKDFISPNKLGWLTICILDNGKNIHKQSFDLPKEYLPQVKINSFIDLEVFYES